MSKRRPTSADRERSETLSRPLQLACYPYGAGHDTEGVCLRLQMGPYRILLDCGLADLEPLLAEGVPPADVVFCSHAHTDHARGLFAFHEAFPQIPIYASEVTVRLLSLNWLEEIALKRASFCQALKWRSPLDVFDNLTAQLFPAGHLPGAAATLLTYKGGNRTYKILYTGDFSLSNLQLVEGLSIEALRGIAPDVLIIEGSYGTTRHPHRRQQEKQLMQRIDEALTQGQSVLLPVPTLGLGQEILKLLRSHHQFTGRELDIWVDGAIAQACDVYLDLLSEFPASVQNFAKHQPLFWDERICPRLRRLNAESQPLLGSTPCIVLSDHAEHLKEYCQAQSGSWLLLMPTFPTEGLMLAASWLSSLTQLPSLEVETYLLAEHSDGRNTTQLIHNLRPQHIIFVHGSPIHLADLTSLEELQNRYQLHSPAVGTLVELPIGDKFIQPDTPAPTAYEGELNELETSVTITLPDTLNQDPRWRQFSDTGLVEARWQGEELVLRGVQERELLSHSSEVRNSSDLDCCSNCRHYRGQRCWNSQSPLHGFKVTSEGYCPVFEAIAREQ